MRQIKPIPKNTSEVLQNTIQPYLGNKSVSDTVYSRNRGNDISVKGDNIKDFSISLEDIDNAVLYYFEHIIKPTVIQNNQRLPVPVIYGSPERWKAVQNDGFYRDKNSKIMVPLIMFKRNTVEKDRTLGNKLDANKPHMFQAFKEKYNKNNFYDKFSILNNVIPSERYYLSIIPDYIKVSYNCILFTDFTEQNNKLIEAIEYASDSYWGDPDRFQFRVNINTFSTNNTVEQGSDKAVKTELTINLNGYIIPDTINKQSVDKNRYFSKSQIIFGLETTSGETENVTFIGSSTLGGSSNGTSFVGGGNNIINQTTNIYNITGSTSGSINPLELTYLNTSITKTATSTTGSIAVFNGSSILQPPSGSSLPQTSINNFSFYANGNYIPNNAIISFSGSINPILTINSSILGYDLEYLSITAIGKFQ